MSTSDTTFEERKKKAAQPSLTPLFLDVASSAASGTIRLRASSQNHEGSFSLFHWARAFFLFSLSVSLLPELSLSGLPGFPRGRKKSKYVYKHTRSIRGTETLSGAFMFLPYFFGEQRRNECLCRSRLVFTAAGGVMGAASSISSLSSERDTFVPESLVRAG